ncbi:MAG: restriction endonuclease subunit S, partial [Ruminococcus sp.]|nr:restriction endonuclease subunit S [Ruminococcus sp.]
LFYTLSNIKNQLYVFNGQGTIFGAINQKSLKELSIVIPPYELIEKFETIVSSLDRVIRNNYNENQRLSAVRDALIPKLINGDIKI